MAGVLLQDIPVATLRAFYHTMVRIRRVEEKIIELYPQQEMKTPVHLYIGQEAVAAGVCACLEREDYIFSTHRCHGHYLAKGGDLKALMAELYGRRTGCCKGKGGSMHLAAPEVGMPGTTAIVGGNIPLAVGAALGSVIQGNGRVAVAFFGDGAVDEGAFHEGLSFASLKRLPVVLVCENNFYATNSPQWARQPLDNIAERAAGYGVPGVRLDGNDVLAVYRAAQEAVGRARAGQGPTLLECRTYRWRAHVGPDCDYPAGCRPREELEEWMARCPILRLEVQLRDQGLLSLEEQETAVRQVEQEIQEAVLFAQDSPFPGPQELLEDIY